MARTPYDWGYGRFSVNNQTYYVHRFAYELLVGPIPDGLTVDHLCRTRLCANPRHLEPVPQSENSRRGIGKGSDSALTNVIQARTVPHMEETTTREPRDRIVVMRLTHSEYETLAAAARRDDRPVSAFVRLVLAAALKGARS